MKRRSVFFIDGMKDGIPIALGYFSVSFGFGISAVGLGISVFHCVMISLTNLTSAGQFEGIHIIALSGTLIEMALVQLVINMRYSLMSLALSQKLDDNFTFPHRLIASYGITDEIFAVCSTKKGKLSPYYMYGIISVSTLGWTTGTLAGATLGAILPPLLTSSLGILLYGMFLAIVIPSAKKNTKILFVVGISALLSSICKYFIPSVSGGFAIIICSVVSATVGALVFPVKETEENS